jgi:hypothetical protein
MKKSVDLIKLISILLLLVVFVSEYYSNIPAIASFILAFGLLSTRYELQDASIIAIIFSSIVVMLFSYFYQNVEGFTDAKKEDEEKEKNEKDKDDEEKDTDDEDDEDDEDEENKDETDNKKKKKEKKKVSKKPKKKGIEEFSDDDSDDDGGDSTPDEEVDPSEAEADEDAKNKPGKKKKEEEQEDYVDIGTSFLEAYKNLSPNQIKSMTKDTKQLLNVQKNLMKTIEGLTPIVKEGKSVLDTFKGYFDELK